jgi:hypothetical protein
MDRNGLCPCWQIGTAMTESMTDYILYVGKCGGYFILWPSGFGMNPNRLHFRLKYQNCVVLA